MKTIQTNSAQKANMRSARKSNKTTTPSSERQKNEKELSAGKKLIQARLPFKIIAGTLPIKPNECAGGSSSDIIEVPPKKRRLSFTEEPDNQKKIGKSDIKENLKSIDKIDPVSSTIDVIVLDEEDEKVSEAEHLTSVSKSPKTPIASGTTVQKKKNKTTPSNAVGTANSTTPKLKIKLPLSGKKKRKSRRISQLIAKADGSDSSDIEFVSGEQDNPQKKVKLDHEHPSLLISSKRVEDESKKDINDDKKEKEKISCESNSPIGNEISTKEYGKEKPSDKPIELEPEPPSPKTSKPTKSNLKTSKSREVETDLQLVKNSSKQSSKSEIPETVEDSSLKIVAKNSPKEKTQKSTSSKKYEQNTSAKENSLTNEDTTPTKETRSSRKSIRVSESEKNKIEAEVVSSEPELVSESTINEANTSLNKDVQIKLLTPKQKKLMEQRKKAREEKELKLQQQKEERERKLQEQREEKDRKLQEEKMQKQKEREERESLRKKEREEKEEQRRREREEKEDQRRKEKEDKDRKRLAEIEVKNEEKRKKDEAKEEERRKKDEDRRRKELEKEEEENKKKKAAQAFTKFFVPKPAKPITDEDQESRDDAESVDSLAFRPFQVKGDMKLAPLIRREFKECSREKLDSFLKVTEKDKSALYIGQLKSKAHTPLRGFKTALKNNYEDDDDDDVIVISSELENAAQTIDEPRAIPIQTYRAKYYFFRENRRPPFHGTWRKKSTVITPRKPFATDKAFFDYEVDSDEEWEEEEPGESLNGSEDEKDESEEEEDYEVDNEWFVPHGHLSDEEMQNEDELGPDTSREAQKAKLKALQQEFAQEMKKKTEKIKPRLIGAIWEDENGNRPKLCPTIIWDSLCTRAMIFCEPPLIEAPEVTESEPSTPPPEKQKRIEIKNDLMKDLVRLVHGNRHSRVFLIKEYMEHVSNTCETIKNGECLPPTKSQIKEKIDEISEWSVVDVVNKKKKNKKKLCWVVAADVLDTHGLANLPLRNEWSYKLQPKFDKDKNDQNPLKETEDKIPKPESSEQIKTVKTANIKPKPPGIVKFTKVITKEDKKPQRTDPDCASPKVISKSSPKISKSLPSPKVKEGQSSPTPAFKKPAPPVKGIVTTTNKTPIVKKRVALLMSVPTGQQFSPQSKNALISKFLQKNKTATVAKSIEADEKSSKVPINSVSKMDVDEVVVLD